MRPHAIFVEVNEIAFNKYREQLDLSAMPKEWLQSYETMTEFERQRWFLERFKCLNSPIYLAGFVAE